MGIDLTGRTALVTGSTHGIGRGIASAISESGGMVVYHGIEVPSDLPLNAAFLSVNLMNHDAPYTLMEQAFEVAPDLDVLVCNAGGFFDLPFLEMTPDAWAKTIKLNVRAPYFLIQAFARRLIAQKRSGAVVITGSTNGLQPEYGSTAYDTSKGALVMMTRSLALTLAEYGIRVNSIAPGLIRTPLTTGWLDEDHAQRAHYEKNIPLGRIGVPDDCGGATAFLLSDAAAYITGQVLVVDGGLTLPQIGKL